MADADAVSDAGVVGLEVVDEAHGRGGGGNGASGGGSGAMVVVRQQHAADAAAAAAAAAAAGLVAIVPVHSPAQRKMHLKSFEGSYLRGQLHRREPLASGVAAIERPAVVLQLAHPEKIDFRIIQAIADGQRATVAGTASAGGGPLAAAAPGVPVEEFLAPATLYGRDANKFRLVLARGLESDMIARLERTAEDKGYQVSRPVADDPIHVFFCTKCNSLKAYDNTTAAQHVGKALCVDCSNKTKPRSRSAGSLLASPLSPAIAAALLKPDGTEIEDIKQRIEALHKREQECRAVASQLEAEANELSRERSRLEGQMAEQTALAIHKLASQPAGEGEGASAEKDESATPRTAKRQRNA